jgi:chromosome segregation ATPase
VATNLEGAVNGLHQLMKVPLSEVVAELEYVVSQLNRIAEAEAAVRKARDDAAAESKKLEGVKAEIATATKQLSDLKSQHTATQQAHADLKAKIADLKSKVSSLVA